jgi:hypothetical protein
MIVVKAHDPTKRGSKLPQHDLLKVKNAATAISCSSSASKGSQDPALSKSLALAAIESNFGESCC